MRKKMEQREDEDLVPDGVRIEPTLDPAVEFSTKPGEIRPISVDEYKKQIEAAKAINENQKTVQVQNDASYDYDEPEKSTWKRVFSSVTVITLVSINLALVYFEIQSKTLKPTFDVATPWGTAEILTPWGADEPWKIALMGARKTAVVEKDSTVETAGNDNK
jgi:hypothetical protein